MQNKILQIKEITHLSYNKKILLFCRVSAKLCLVFTYCTKLILLILIYNVDLIFLNVTKPMNVISNYKVKFRFLVLI